MATDEKLKRHKIVAHKIKGKSRQEYNEFVEFFRGQGVVGLAIGFVLGAEVKSLVSAFTKSYIDPLVGLILPGNGQLIHRTLSITLGSQTAVFGVGSFLFALIDFLIIVLIIYLTYRWLKLDKLDKKQT
jgi:large conductance mechanosensitive channel